MKNLIYTVALLVSVAFVSSCKKDYTCTCTSTSGGVTATSSVTYHAKKKDAEASCNVTATSGGSTTTCKLD